MPTSEPRVIQRDVGKRWTPLLAKAGWTPVSDYFLDNFHRLNPPIRHGEAMLVVLLMRHKWDADPPFPGFKSLAKRLGISVTAARHLARKLEKKGYLIRQKQVGTTNRFHLQPLFAALEELLEQELSKYKLSDEAGSPDLVAALTAAWIELERAAVELAKAANQSSHGKMVLGRNPFLTISTMAGMGVIPAAVFEEIDQIRRIRDAVVHGSSEAKKMVTTALVAQMKGIIDDLLNQQLAYTRRAKAGTGKAPADPSPAPSGPRTPRSGAFAGRGASR